MATRKNNLPTEPKIIFLTISNEEFRTKLIDRIKIGEELHSRQVQNDIEFKKFKSDCDIWTDYNFELLKQVFNHTENVYMDTYNHAGYSFMGQMGEVANNPVLRQRKILLNINLKSCVHFWQRLT